MKRVETATRYTLLTSRTMKIVIDNKIPFIEGTLEGVAKVVYLAGSATGKEDIRDADALITRTRTKCTKELLQGSNVTFIATATIGYDHIDTAYCDKHGIAWTNAPGCNSSSVEQYMVAVLLHLAGKYKFKPGEKTIGIIGVGNVGSKVKRVSEALGFKVLCNDPPRERIEGPAAYTSLEDLLAKSDIICLHVPLAETGQDATYEMANQAFITKMKEGTFFINTSRGEVVNEADLKANLASGKIKAAVLDVFRDEPAIDNELLQMLELATPHIAGYSTDGKVNGTVMSVRALSRHFGLNLDQWKPQDVPTPEDPVIFADGSEEDDLTFISEIYKQTYDVLLDHQNLLNNKEDFEILRGDYRVRREASAYSVRLYNDDGKYRKVLEELGFSVLGDSCF